MKRGGINVKQNSLKWEYATSIRGNAVREMQCFTKGIKPQGSNNTITTPTRDISRKLGAKLHEAAQGILLSTNGLVADRLNEPLNS